MNVVPLKWRVNKKLLPLIKTLFPLSKCLARASCCNDSKKYLAVNLNQMDGQNFLRFVALTRQFLLCQNIHFMSFYYLRVKMHFMFDVFYSINRRCLTRISILVRYRQYLITPLTGLSYYSFLTRQYQIYPHINLCQCVYHLLAVFDIFSH